MSKIGISQNHLGKYYIWKSTAAYEPVQYLTMEGKWVEFYELSPSYREIDHQNAEMASKALLSYLKTRPPEELAAYLANRILQNDT